MVILQIITALALLSTAAASSSDCADLVRPLSLEDRTSVQGKWIVVAAAAEQHLQNAMKQFTSSWFENSPTDDDGIVHMRWVDRVNGKCVSGSVNAVMTGNTNNFTFDSAEHHGEYLQTCPDCLLYLDTSRGGDAMGRVLIMSKRESTILASEFDTFKRQAVCLNFPQTYFSYNASDICPYEKETAVE